MAFRAAIARRLGVEDERVALFWKGRVAFYSLLKAMGVGPGDEVILPAYTCVVVPNAVLYCGATPVYADIDLDTFCAGADAIRAKWSPRTKVVVCQNTYGLSAQVDVIAQCARALGLRTIEDCTHGFGGTFLGRPNGTWCDAAFFSTQWNKPFSTGVGGFSLLNDPSLVGPLAGQCADLAAPSEWDVLNLSGLYLLRDCLLNDWTYWALLKGYRALSAANLVLGSSSAEELEGGVAMPKAYRKGMSSLQARRGLKALLGFNRSQAMRKTNAEELTRFLAQRGRNHVRMEMFKDHAFCKYPLLVEDRDTFVDRARSCRVSLGDWFCSPLHPVSRDLDPWHFDPSMFPRAVLAARHVVNLPLSDGELPKLFRFLERHLDQVCPADWGGPEGQACMGASLGASSAGPSDT